MDKTKLRPFYSTWMGFVGLTIAGISLVFIVVLVLFDLVTVRMDPHVGVVTYLILPGVFMLGVGLVFVSAILRSIKHRRKGVGKPVLDQAVELNRRSTVTQFVLVPGITCLFLSFTTLAGFKAYHFTESVEFCGLVCHTIQKPDLTTFLDSEHANLRCTDCHVGPGLSGFVRSKITGAQEVFATVFNTYSRPIESPLANMPPAKDVCISCHWPKTFSGSHEKRHTYFRGDEENSPWTIRMLLHIGGGDSDSLGPWIHWHKGVEYIATDPHRLVIPWVRVTDEDGRVTVYETSDMDHVLSEQEIDQAEIRTMDCMDCHNRVGHEFYSPEDAVNAALAKGLIDPTLPSIKAKAVEALMGDYPSEEEALQFIREQLTEDYPEADEHIEQAIVATQKIYQRNFFPEMNANWLAYPDHIGHFITPGCFRCHDGKHVSDDDVISRDCDTCHTIISQGPGQHLEGITTDGLEFEHPEDIDGEWRTSRCDDCHEGVPIF